MKFIKLSKDTTLLNSIELLRQRLDYVEKYAMRKDANANHLNDFRDLIKQFSINLLKKIDRTIDFKQ